MAQPATNPKIEELRFRLKTDPKSRLFYQLAEELRRGGHFAEAEQVLRSGLEVYPTYLAAWVSLGRVLRELKNDGGAVEALTKAMQLDPGNVVAARLLADSYRALGDKLEAIKKYKLVHALMPGDEELKATIEQLDRELHPPAPAPEPEPVSSGAAAAPAADIALAEPPAAEAAAAPQETESPFEKSAAPFDHDEPVSSGAAAAPAADIAFEEPPAAEAAAAPQETESPFEKTTPPFDEDEAVATGDVEPMLLAHDESPFEEPAAENAIAASLEVEQPLGMHIDDAPLAAEVPTPLVYEPEPEPVFAEATTADPAPHEEPTETTTMADLYARQGLLNEARHIYENILARDPGNIEVRAKLDAITPRVNPKIERLERWLAKVGKREVGRV